jgi:hypothetical protein
VPRMHPYKARNYLRIHASRKSRGLKGRESAARLQLTIVQFDAYSTKKTCKLKLITLYQHKASLFPSPFSIGFHHFFLNLAPSHSQRSQSLACCSESVSGGHRVTTTFLVWAWEVVLVYTPIVQACTWQLPGQ